MIGRLRAAGFSLAMTAHAHSLLNSYIYGFALTAMNLPFETTAEVAEVAQDLLQRLPVNEYPNLVEFITEHAMKPGYDHEGQFEYGLDVDPRRSREGPGHGLMPVVSVWRVGQERPAPGSRRWRWPPMSPAQHRVHRPRHLPLALLQHVAVGVRGQRDGAVPEQVLDVLEGHALGQPAHQNTWAYMPGFGLISPVRSFGLF